MRHIRLGPIVGHTDESSSRVWIRVDDDASHYELRIAGVGTTPFVSTEAVFEFGTAVAVMAGLSSDREYRYRVLRRGRSVPGAKGRFRTMPPDDSLAPIEFAFVSCSGQAKAGAWAELRTYVERSRPHFLLMMGDQVYVDEPPNVWRSHIDKPGAARRLALADKYQENWSRDDVRAVLSSVPTYMVWDDHEIRDGWGSLAPDSPALADRYRLGRRIFGRHDSYFRDARDVYWHFQMSHNPPREPIPPGQRRAMPFAFRCGKVVVAMLDSRGERDVFRQTAPVLGAAQWSLIDALVDGLGTDVEALIIVTPVPIATMSPLSLGQQTVARLQPDVRLFRRGADRRLANLVGYGSTAPDILPGLLTGLIDDLRDQWAYKACRPEQARLVRTAARATTANRPGRSRRVVSFLGGDIHMGGIFRIDVDRPKARLDCIVSSGIGQLADRAIDRLTVVDRSFVVKPGIRSTMKSLVQKHNFGVYRVFPTGDLPEVQALVATRAATTRRA